MGPHLNMEPQLVWLLNLLSQIKSVPAEKKGGSRREGMLAVAPALISSKPNLTHTYNTLTLTPYNIPCAWPPDSNNIWK